MTLRWAWIGSVLLLGLGSAPAYAQPAGHCEASDPCWESFHFSSDTSRQARVDSAGGIGTGYSFSIDYDPTDGNSEDFCPHCRLTILTSDPGIDLGILEQVGVERSQIGSASGMLTRFQSIVAADPTGLAMELNAGIMGAELEAVVDEIEAIQARVAVIVTALEAFETMESLSFNWATASVDDLIEALSLRMDTAFRGDFNDPNDLLLYNSGARVYSIPEFVSSLPVADQTSIQSALENIPGIGGGLEISGDDDSPLDPVRFHGRHTDLTVRQRTYAVNGTSAFLIVYTLVNETTRVFPFVQVAQMADVDIPPLSYDTETAFDPALRAALVYDTIPYTDPEEHYWFGVAPAALTGGGPDSFMFSNYNLDKNYTLAQWGSDSTQESRYRWFLWDPTLSGDHDDAVGKSEKQVAVAMLLNGPMLPGDQRTVAFCYAGGEGGSNAAARAATTAALAACQAMYTGVSPTCGNEIREFGEECDEVSEACTPACQNLVCGDGRRFTPEECDDGNTDEGDGCSSTCQNEICGNRVPQFGEECDDGNLSNADSCTTDCGIASCGDGYLHASSCAEGAPCGCVGYEYCLSGSFRLDTYPMSPSTFDPLREVPIEFRIGFDALNVEMTSGPLGLRTLEVSTGEVHVEMSGHPQALEIAEGLEGRRTVITISSSILTSTTFSVSRMVTRTAVGFEIASNGSSNIQFDRDTLGYPILSSLTVGNARAQLTRAVAGVPDNASDLQAAVTIRTAPTVGEAIEACDDGNASNFDDCTNACEPAVCGDNFVQMARGEQCDEGMASSTWCNPDCTLAPVAIAACGDSSSPLDPGETCDDGNVVDGDGCSALCQAESCGDGVVQPASEACDDGANGDGDGCTDDCVVEFCGDGTLQPAEDCDTGSLIADTAECLSTCEVAACGDGFVLAGVEDCDDMNLEAGDGCNSTCISEVCGDGAPGPDEDCDDGNTAERDGCTPDCRFEICGDGRPGPDEQCDDGNLSNGDGCNKDCLLENPMACGDGTINRGEQCDDSGTASGDGCDAFCQLENPAACGDGTVDPGEQCDDANSAAGDGCSARCTEERCGDGIQARGESCDDGNMNANDGCDPTCVAELSECGDGLQEYGEQCDDGNEDDTDTCTMDCHINPPGSAPLIDTCNDGDLDFGEQCDDGNRDEGDGCDATCQREATVCGNARLEYGETCDEGDVTEGDGCSATCRIEGEEPPPPRRRSLCNCTVPGGAPTPMPWILGGLIGLALVIRRRAR